MRSHVCVSGRSSQPIIDFIRELDELKGVKRKTRPLGLARLENTAEHSWQLAAQAMALPSYAESPIKLERAVSMLLLHDIGEIAGTGHGDDVCRARPCVCR